MFSGLRIVSIVRAQVVLISILVIGILSVNLWNAWQDRNKAIYIDQVLTATELVHVMNFSIMRQQIALDLAISLPRHMRAPFMQEADTMQEQTMAAFDELTTHLEGNDIAEDSRFKQLFANTETAVRALGAARLALIRSIDDQAVGNERRRTEVADVFRDAATHTFDLGIRLENSLRALDAVVAQQIGVRQHAGLLWDAVEKQQMLVSLHLARARDMDALPIAEIADGQDVIEDTWTRMNELAAASVAADVLAPALNEAQQTFYLRYVNAIEGIIEAPSEASFNFDEWQSLVKGATDSLYAVEQVAAQVMREITDENRTSANVALLVGLGVALLSTLIMLQVFVVMQTRLIHPVGQLVAAIQKISRGNLDDEVALREQKDEIGEIAAALDNLRREGVKARTAEAARAQEQKKEAERARLIKRLAQDFDASITQGLDHNLELARAVDSSAHAVQSTSENASQQSEVVDQSAEQATHNVQTVASASEELAASIHEINMQIEQSRALSEEAVGQVRETSQKIMSLSESAAKIDSVRQLINDIAEKTNLLALNAAIEAARAGEAGKGFNIVASEVKDLAKQTADATGEIDRQIRAMETDTREVVQGADMIEGFITRVNESIATIASAAEEQSAATQEISRSVQDAAAGTRQVSDSMGDVRKASQDAHRKASEMLRISADITAQSEQLREKFAEFLDQVRKA